MNKRQISFDSEKYKNDDLMWDDIFSVSKVLIKQDYQVLIRYEDCGVYILEYAYEPNKLPGCDMFMCVTPDEADMIDMHRMNPNTEDIGICEEEEE